MKLSNIKPRKNLTYCGTGHRPDKLKGGFKNFDFTNLVDFGGTAQKEQLVYLARCVMSMSKLMAKPAYSTIVSI